MKNKHKNQAASENSEATMSLSGHLKELRGRIAVTVIAILIVFGICLANAKQLVAFFTGMADQYGYNFVYISPQELLMQYFSLSLVIALVVCIPLIAWQTWKFVQPGLKKNENIAFAFSLIFGMLFFCLGVFFAYKISLPYILYFLKHIGEGSNITDSISIREYIALVITILMIFGCIFEMPVISVVLTALGLIKSAWLKKARKVAIVFSFVLAAIITPPDVVSQIMVALPMIALFQLSILLSDIVEKARKKRAL